MNDHDPPIAGLDLLDVPPPGPAFWDDLRSALVAAHEHRTGVDAGDVPPSPPRRFRPTRTVLVAVTLVLLLGGAALAVGRWADQPNDATVGSPAGSVVIEDPLAIDLDPWATGEPRTGGPYVVFDVEQLPDGWELERVDGWHRLGDLDADHYGWAAAVVTDDGQTLSLDSQRPDRVGTGGSVRVTVHGRQGVAWDRSIAWFEESGTWLRVTVLDADAEIEAAELVDIAEQLAVATVDRLPVGDVSDGGDPAAGTRRLAGVVAGRTWEVVTTASGIALNVDGSSLSSSEGHRTGTRTTWDVAITGVGNGAIAYGFVPASVEAVTVNLDGASVTLPVVPVAAGGAAVFAVPIPAGLDLSRFQFVDAAGRALHSVWLAEFLVPAGGSHVWMSRRFGSGVIDRLEFPSYADETTVITSPG